MAENAEKSRKIKVPSRARTHRLFSLFPQKKAKKTAPSPSSAKYF